MGDTEGAFKAAGWSGSQGEQHRLHTLRPRPFAARQEQVEAAPGLGSATTSRHHRPRGCPEPSIPATRALRADYGGDCSSSPAPAQAQSRGGVGGPVARGHTGGPSSAHREGDVPNAAHRIAVVSRVDSPGEDLMQMHLGILAGPSSAPEEDEPRARPQPLPVRPRGLSAPLACRLPAAARP